MKKILFVFTMLLSLCVVLGGCGDMTGTPTPTTYKITFDSDGGSNVAAIVSEAGAEIAAPTDPTKEGFTFVGWYLGEVEYEFSVMPETNITLVAKWEKVQDPNPDPILYTITFDVNGGNTLVEASITALAGSALTLPLASKEGFNFLGWYNGEVKFEEVTMPEANITLVAKWEEIETPNPDPVLYTLTFDVNGGNALAESTITAEAGAAITLPTPTKEGYNFAGWLFEGAIFNETLMPEVNLTLVAKWEEIKATIAGKKVSILGDSISTFYAEGSEMNSYYSGENQFYYPRYSATIKTVDLTWWYQLIKNNNLTLGINNSWSGSCASGTTASAGVQDSRIDTLDDNGTPDVVIIYLGTNDCAGAYEVSVFAEAIETIVAKVKALGVSDIFITTLGYSAYDNGKYTDANRILYNAEIRRIAGEQNCGIVPLDDYIQDDSYMFYLGDNLHYNAKGAALLAKVYEKAIKEYFGVEFNEEIVVERKEKLPEGVIGKITATSNTNFWGDYKNNVFLVDTTFTNPQFSYRIEITKNEENGNYYVTKIKESGDASGYTETADFVLVISDSHENSKALVEGLENVVVGSIVNFDDTLAFPVEVIFREGDGNGPSTDTPTPEPDPGNPPYVPLEGQLHVGAYNEGIWTLYSTTVLGYSYERISTDSSTFINFYIIKLTKNADDDNYTITELKTIDVANTHSECDYYILIYRDLEAKSFFENAVVGGTVVMTDDITSGNCSLEFK